MDDERRLARLDEELAKIMHAQNQTPDPEMGGLAAEQVYRLVYSEWDSVRSPLQLRRDLALEDYEASPFFLATRKFLLAILEGGGVKTTATGNLPRKFVAEMMDVFLDAEYKEDVLRVNKVVNETDVFPLHISRIVCGVSGLIGKSKGRFVVRKKCQKLLAPERAGELFSALFITYFRKFNLSFADGMPCEGVSLQSNIAYSLQRIQAIANDWQPIEGVGESILLPKVSDDIEQEIVDRPYLTISRIVELRILSHLHRWGLLELNYEQGKYVEELQSFRKTPLFDRVVGFSF